MTFLKKKPFWVELAAILIGTCLPGFCPTVDKNGPIEMMMIVKKTGEAAKGQGLKVTKPTPAPEKSITICSKT